MTRDRRHSRRYAVHRTPPWYQGLRLGRNRQQVIGVTLVAVVALLGCSDLGSDRSAGRYGCPSAEVLVQRSDETVDSGSETSGDALLAALLEGDEAGLAQAGPETAAAEAGLEPVDAGAPAVADADLSEAECAYAPAVAGIDAEQDEGAFGPANMETVIRDVAVVLPAQPVEEEVLVRGPEANQDTAGSEVAGAAESQAGEPPASATEEALRVADAEKKPRRRWGLFGFFRARETDAESEQTEDTVLASAGDETVEGDESAEARRAMAPGEGELSPYPVVQEASPAQVTVAENVAEAVPGAAPQVAMLAVAEKPTAAGAAEDGAEALPESDVEVERALMPLPEEETSESPALERAIVDVPESVDGAAIAALESRLDLEDVDEIHTREAHEDAEVETAADAGGDGEAQQRRPWFAFWRRGRDGATEVSAPAEDTDVEVSPADATESMTGEAVEPGPELEMGDDEAAIAAVAPETAMAPVPNEMVYEASPEAVETLLQAMAQDQVDGLSASEDAAADAAGPDAAVGAAAQGDGEDGTKRPWFAFWRRQDAEAGLEVSNDAGEPAEAEAADMADTVDADETIAQPGEEHAESVAEVEAEAGAAEVAADGAVAAVAEEGVAEGGAEQPADENPEATEELRRRSIEKQMRQVAARKEFEAGKRLFQAAAYEKALTLFRKAETLDPDSPEIASYLRKTQALIGGDEKAMTEAMLEQIANRAKIEQDMSGVRVKAHLDRAERFLEGANTIDGEEELLPRESQLNRSRGDVMAGLEALEKADMLLMGSMTDSISRSDMRERSQALREALIAERTEVDEALKTLRIEQAKREAQDNKQNYEETHRNTIEQLMSSAQFHLERKEYEKTKEILEEVMAREPGYSKAYAMRDKVRFMFRNDKQARIDRNLVHSEENWALDVNEMATVTTAMVVYPEDWQAIKERSGRTAVVEGRREAWMQEYQETLETMKIDLEFDNLPLGEVIRYLQDQTRINIVTDETVDLEIGVTLSVRGMTLGKALDWILRLTNLHRELRDQAIYISGEPKSEVTMKLYPVSDLERDPQDYYGPSLGRDEGGSGGGGDDGGGLFADDDDDDDDDDDGLSEDLVERIKRVIAPESWEDGEGRVSANMWEDNLLVIQTASVHTQIAEYLTRLRASRSQQVLVEGRFIEVVENFVEQIGFQWGDESGTTSISPGDQVGELTVPGGLPSGYMNRSITDRPVDRDHRALITGLSILPDAGLPGGEDGLWLPLKWITNHALHGYEVNAVLEAVRKNRKGSVLHNPRLLVANGRNAFMEVSTQTNYISGYQMDQGYPVPTVDVMREGVVFDVRPVISFDKKYVTVRLRPTMSQRSAATVTDTLNIVGSVYGDEDGGLVTTNYTIPVEHPIMQYTRIYTTVTVPDGGTVMIGGLIRDTRASGRSGVPLLSDVPLLGRLTRSEKTNRDKKNLLLMIGTKIVELEEE